MTKFYSTKSQSFVDHQPNTCKYYVCSIKPKTKVMRLHKIYVEKISLFHLKKCAVNYFYVLPVMIQGHPVLLVH